LGRAIAHAFCKSTSLRHVVAVLLARAEGRLIAARDELVLPHPPDSGLPTVDCTLLAADLGDLGSLDGTLDRVFAEALKNVDLWDDVVLVNNAGSLSSTIGSCLNYPPSLDELRQNVDLNVTSSLWTTIRLVRFLGELKHSGVLAQRTAPRRATIVNISSLVAVEPFPSLAVYSSGKAARNAFHLALAKETADQDKSSLFQLKILNYAPGPLETDMSDELRVAPGLHFSLQSSYQKTLISPLDSARVLVDLVLSGDFDNGQHVDYYDRVQESSQV
jgi:sepiapterin reductase